MKSLIKLFGILFLSLLVNSCSSIKVSTPKSVVSFYPSDEDLDLIIDPPIVVKQDKNSDMSAILKSLKFVYKLQKNKGLLNVGKIQYEDRFDNIIIKKDTKNNIRILKDMIETMSKNSNNEDFDFNGIILSSIDKKEPKENTLKIGFEIVNKKYPYLKGYRSIKVKGKKRYTEFIILQNSHGNSKYYTDITNLIKYFILMPMHKYHYEPLQTHSFSLIWEWQNGKLLHIYRYSLKEKTNFRTFKSDYKKEIILPQKLRLLLPYSSNIEDYCSIFDMNSHRTNTFLYHLDNYPHTKSKYLKLDTKNQPKKDNINKVKCEDRYIYNIKDTDLGYTKETLDKIIANNYIIDKIALSNSPISDISFYKQKLYLTTIGGDLVIYDIKSHNFSMEKISNTPLYKIGISKNYICVGGANGYIYNLDRLSLKKYLNYKVSKDKISSLKFYDEKVLLYSFMNHWQSISSKGYKQYISNNDFIIRKIDIYNNKIITGGNFIKLWQNGKAFYTYPKENSPIVTLIVWKDKAIALYQNNKLIKYNLKSPYGILETKQFYMDDDLASDMVIYKNMFIISTRKGSLYIIDKDGNKIKTLNGFGKINRLLYNGGKIYIATHSGFLYVFDIRLWRLLEL